MHSQDLRKYIKGFTCKTPAVIGLYIQTRTTLTNKRVAACQCYALYIEGASPQTHGTLAKWKLRKCQLNDKNVITLLLHQGCREKPCNLLSFSCNGAQVSTAIQAPWLAPIYAIAKPKDASK